MSPLDPSKPPDDQDIPAFPSYLRGVWTNNIIPAHVPCQFSMWQQGPVVGGINAGPEIVVSATPNVPINVLSVVGRLKVPSTSGNVGVEVFVNGANMLGTTLIVPVNEKTSVSVVPTVAELHDGDLLTMNCTQVGTGASGLSVHLLCSSRVTYP